MSFSPNGRYLATGGDNGAIKIWETVTWREVAILMQGKGIHTFSLSFSPDNQLLAAACGEFVIIWDTSDWFEAARIHHVSRHLNFSSDSRLLATAGLDNTARVWEIATRKEMARIAHDDQVTNVAFDPGGQRLVTASRDSTACIWETSGHRHVQCLPHYNYVHSVEFSPNGEFLATASANIPPDKRAMANGVRVWRVAGWQELELTFGGDAGALSFSADNKYLAVASSDGHMRVLEVSTGREVFSSTHTGHVAFDPAGRYLAVGDTDGSIHLWRVAGWCEIEPVPHGSEITCVCFSRDGRFLATACHEGIARVWELTTARTLLNVRHPDHFQRSDRGPDIVSNRLQSIAFSPNGQYLATGSVDGTARIWDIATEQQLMVLGHGDYVNAVQFDSSGQFIATGSSDKNGRVWDVVSGGELLRVKHEESVSAVNFSPDSRILATSSWDKTVRVWLIQPDDLITEARSRLTRDLSAQERLRYLADNS